MTSLHKSILATLGHLSVVFFIGWAKLGQANVLDLGEGFYILIVLATLVTIGIPLIRKVSVYLSLGSWTLLYLIYRLINSNQRPLIGGLDTYRTLIEIALLSISIFLAYEVMRNLHQMENTLARVMLPNLSKRVLSLTEANKDVATEFVRARRHNRPMALVVIQPAEGAIKTSLSNAIHQIQSTLLERFMVSSIAQLIDEEARRIDLIIQRDEAGRFVVLCPETSADGSQILASRIQETAQERLGINIHYGIASFPEHALTFEEILAKAESNLAEQLKKLEQTVSAR